VEKQPVQPKPEPRESVIAKFGDWDDHLVAGMRELLRERCDGMTCMSTPEGKSVHVLVWFKEAGRT
jgi:hypothetical protein